MAQQAVRDERVLAAIGLGMAKRAIAALKHESLTPRRTTQTLQENKEWLKTRLP